MDDEPRLTSLDLRVVTITEDEDGCLSLNHEGMSERDAAWILQSAFHLLLDGYWYDREDDEDDE